MKTCRKNSTWIPYSQSVLQLLKIVMILEYIHGYLVVYVREKLQTKVHVFKLRQLTKMLKCQGKTSKIFKLSQLTKNAKKQSKPSL